MDWWVLKQLRAKVLEDLREFTPQGYFEENTEKLKFHTSIEDSDHYSREMSWGCCAAKLGKKLFFESPDIMSARQVSACDVLMNLGMLAAAEAAQAASEKVARAAQDKGIPNGNSGAAASQLSQQHVPALSENVVGALKQYLLHLTPLEGKPFLSLLTPGSLEEVPNFVDTVVYHDVPLQSKIELMSDIELTEFQSQLALDSPGKIIAEHEWKRRQSTETSRVTAAPFHKPPNTDENNEWYKKPIGIAGITIFSGIMVSLAVYLIRKHLGIPL